MKLHQVIRLALLGVVCMLAQTRAPAQVALRQLVCPPGPIPVGWIKVDVVSSPATCGGNGAVIEPYTNRASGSAMAVCADQATPAGWETLGFATSTGQCTGDTTASGNLKVIRRLG